MTDEVSIERDLTPRNCILSTARLVAASWSCRERAISSTIHMPVEVAREARKFAAEAAVDCAIAIGGGSTIALGKAITLESSLLSWPYLPRTQVAK